MSLPTVERLTAEQAYNRIAQQASSAKSLAIFVRSLCVGDGLPIEQAMRLHRALKEVRSFGDLVESVSGLGAYAAEAAGDPSYDIHAAYADAVAAGEAVTAWLVANLPQDGTGRYVAWVYADPSFERLTLSPVDVSGLVPLLDDLLANLG